MLRIIFLICFLSQLTAGQDDKEVCYGELGCFTNLPGEIYEKLPEPPYIIGSRFEFFNKGSFDDFVEIHYNATDNYDHVNIDSRIAFIIHGFMGRGKSAQFSRLRQALLTKYESVINVNWATAAFLDYFYAIKNSQLIGREIALLIHRLNVERNIQLEKVHIVGFSLGSHVAGWAGRWMQKRYNSSIGRITALDAAQPLVDGTVIHIEKEDTLFVDAIHTSAGSLLGIARGNLGTMRPFAHVDFYPNGGSSMPHCWNPVCNHFSAIDYMTSSINSCQYEAVMCDDYESFKAGNCSQIKSRMGFFSEKTSVLPIMGKFYLDTGNNSPYCSYKIEQNAD